MKIVIEGEVKEIAEFAKELQTQLEKKEVCSKLEKLANDFEQLKAEV